VFVSNDDFNRGKKRIKYTNQWIKNNKIQKLRQNCLNILSSQFCDDLRRLLLNIYIIINIYSIIIILNIYYIFYIINLFIL